MKLMQPIANDSIPEGKEWVFETKYDGFRAVLHWKKDSINLISRNGKDLSSNFPEILAFCREKQPQIADLLPLSLDGEIVILNTLYQANFQQIQQRGRFKTVEKIEKAAKARPAHLLCFDLLSLAGKDLSGWKYYERKEQLSHLFTQLEIKRPIDWDKRLGYIKGYHDWTVLWKKIEEHRGEGMVTKRRDSRYATGKNHRDWLKVKNWRVVSCIITGYSPSNGYFNLGIYRDGVLVSIGKFKHGLEGESLAMLKQLVQSKGEKQKSDIKLPPAICVDINCLDIQDGELREPVFRGFRVDLQPDQCTWRQAKQSLAMLPPTISLSNQEKIFYPEKKLVKGDLVHYLREISPYMLPFLKNKALTVIRCPEGVDGESFFQKHLPDYAPDFLAGSKSGEDILLHCGTEEGLVWLGNHGALEYHVPFQYMRGTDPIEIVFDLDPPSIKEFRLAVFAAQLLKKMLDQLQLLSFVKTSGNKGIQVYVPIPENSLTYQDTATFTQALAMLLVKQHSDLFTIERLKKNRGNKLYVDYVQHGRDKTLIAPYSPRKNDLATVSAPLFWEEVTERLSPAHFTLENTIERVQAKGCPFAGYDQARDSQKLELLIQFIKNSN
ncbi:DNA ligase D [Virgibacillus senegalensis]|uniref:DNA ligase D n=1 Tax=Virgibacillus senegalensis TaxID=1499679 RepID=UPI00069E9D92|nr:DNA ligase D [Virgibacillus senegalensis]